MRLEAARKLKQPLVEIGRATAMLKTATLQPAMLANRKLNQPPKANRKLNQPPKTTTATGTMTADRVAAWTPLPTPWVETATKMIINVNTMDNTPNKRYWRSGEPDKANQETTINS